MKKRFLAIFSVVALIALVATPVCYANTDALEEITEGVYQTTGKTHFLNDKIAFEKWGEEYIMKAIIVQNESKFDMQVVFKQQEKNYFYGSGKVYVRYPDGSTCAHKMAASLYAYADEIFLKENTPTTMPYNPNGGCYPAGPYVWFQHEKPFTLVR